MGGYDQKTWYTGFDRVSRYTLSTDHITPLLQIFAIFIANNHNIIMKFCSIIANIRNIIVKFCDIIVNMCNIIVNCRDNYCKYL